MNIESHDGGCLCGGVNYRIDGSLNDIAHCHCAMCRKNSGGIVTTWVTVPVAAFSWVTGKAAVYHSSANTKRFFCSNCGALLALFTERSPNTIDVTLATLNDAEQHPATRHIWFADKLSWLQLDKELPHEDGEII